MNVVDRKPVPIYEVECLECHSIIQYKKSEASLGSINCPVCGIPIWVDILADTIRPVRYEEAENAYMPQELIELEKMSLAELIIYLAIKDYKVSIGSYETKQLGSCILIEMRRNTYLYGQNLKCNHYISYDELNNNKLSYETIIKINILDMVKEFNKFDEENKKKVTT